ncbi:hypothetical protein PX699_26170 [Sphingobium sp. H39-3-25]|uniref:hypothetical protein n=1 Tax=Sphingobium arseniciresistens TaxID=3030834 RepID=UPI0023B8B0E1|nr:hypothetical protein [Sphingobium arseniciresistens]
MEIRNGARSALERIVAGSGSILLSCGRHGSSLQWRRCKARKGAGRPLLRERAQYGFGRSERQARVSLPGLPGGHRQLLMMAWNAGAMRTCIVKRTNKNWRQRRTARVGIMGEAKI